jgi:hypothetical protein
VAVAEPAKKTLYADPSQTRFYWIPDDAAIPPGELVLRSLTGKRLDVSAAAVQDYRITEEQAKELTREVVARASKTASALLAGLGGMLQEASKRAAEVGRPPPGDREPKVADALGVTEDQLRNDPDAVVEGIKRAGQGLQQVLKEAIDTGREADAATRERVRRLAEMAGANIDATQTTVDELLEKLREFLANPELEKRVNDATTRLKDLADELRTERRGVGPGTTPDPE